LSDRCFHALHLACSSYACLLLARIVRLDSEQIPMQIYISSRSFLHSVPSRAISCQRGKYACIVSKHACRPRCLASTAQSLVTLPLTAQDITPEAFAPFGQVYLGCCQPFACECCSVFTMLFAEAQVIGATDDGKSFDDTDAALKLDLGTPRCA